MTTPDQAAATSASLWDEIGRLILLAGTDRFDAEFYAASQQAFGQDQCNVFVFDKDLETAPRCVISTASDAPMRQLTRDVSHEYLAHGFRRDPTLDTARKRGFGPRSRHLQHVSGTQIGDRFYRSRFYDRALVREKLAMISHLEGRVIYLNFYRNPNQSGYAAADCARLDAVGGALGGLLAKHLELIGVSGTALPGQFAPMSPQYRERLIERVRNAMLGACDNLTPREAEVCAAVAIGLTTEGIGLTLGVSVNTVATHRKRAYAKLGISSQNELFARFHESVAQQMRQLRAN